MTGKPRRLIVTDVPVPRAPDAPTAAHEFIAEALHSKTSIRIVYQGGSQPGTAREITPLSAARGKLRALDHATGKVKLFALDKIEIAPADARVYQSRPVPDLPDGLPVGDALEGHRTELETLGWVVAIEHDAVALYQRKKNGEPRSYPRISLRYEEFIEDAVMDLETGEFIVERRKAERPYYLDSPSGSRRFGHLSSSRDAFLADAKTFAGKG